MSKKDNIIHFYRLECQSCGSSDVSIEPPYYKCNYCHSVHLLPLRYALFDMLKNNFKKIMFAFLIFLILTDLIIFHQEDKYSKVSLQHAKVSKTDANKDRFKKNSFRNIVFSTKTFRTINTIKKTRRDTYLIAGQDSYRRIRVMEFSANGKMLWNKSFGESYYVDVMDSNNGGTIITYHQMLDGGETIKIDDTGKIIYKKETYYNAIEQCGNGIIGARGGIVYKIDKNGHTVWHVIVDSKQIVKRVGKKTDKKSGKLVPYSSTISELNLKHIVKLINGNYVTIGNDNNMLIHIIIISPNGKMIKHKIFNFGKIYNPIITASSDGGFALMPQNSFKFFKFDSQANLTSRKKVMGYIKDLYNYSIVERDEGGYMTTSSIGKSASIQITQIDKYGNKINIHRYNKDGIRLHPEKIIKAYGKGYLMIVNSEIHEPWIVNILNDGTMDANLNNPSLSRKQHSDQKSLSAKESNNIFSSSRTFQDGFKYNTKKGSTKKIVLKTSIFLGGRFIEMVPSKDGKYLYTITNATGFKIISIDKDGKFKTLSNILRTKSKLLIKPQYVGPIDGKPPKHGTPYDYDAPKHIVINSGETRAFISDANHGLYVVNIKDKLHPKIVTVAKNIKSGSFILNKNENSLIFYADGKIIEIAINELNKITNKYLMNNRYYESINKNQNGKYIIVRNRNDLLLYDAETKELLTRYSTKKEIQKVVIGGDDRVYIIVNYNDIKILKIDHHTFSFVDSLNINNYAKSMIALPMKNNFCYGGKTGAICLDISNKLNPIQRVTLMNDTLGNVESMAISYDKKKLFISYYPPSIASTDIRKVYSK